MPFLYQCLECDAGFYTEEPPEEMLCPACSALIPECREHGGGWIDACFHPLREDIYRIKMADNSEHYAVWKPELKGWCIDLPDSWKPGDPIGFDTFGVLYYRELERAF